MAAQVEAVTNYGNSPDGFHSGDILKYFKDQFHLKLIRREEERVIKYSPVGYWDRFARAHYYFPKSGIFASSPDAVRKIKEQIFRKGVGTNLAETQIEEAVATMESVYTPDVRNPMKPMITSTEFIGSLSFYREEAHEDGKIVVFSDNLRIVTGLDVSTELMDYFDLMPSTALKGQDGLH